jgi:hypothetical protein
MLTTTKMTTTPIQSSNLTNQFGRSQVPGMHARPSCAGKNEEPAGYQGRLEGRWISAAMLYTESYREATQWVSLAQRRSPVATSAGGDIQTEKVSYQVTVALCHSSRSLQAKVAIGVGTINAQAKQVEDQPGRGKRRLRSMHR